MNLLLFDTCSSLRITQVIRYSGTCMAFRWRINGMFLFASCAANESFGHQRHLSLYE